MAQAPAVRRPTGDANLLVGLDTGDDAAVYGLDDTRAIVLCP